MDGLTQNEDLALVSEIQVLFITYRLAMWLNRDTP